MADQQSFSNHARFVTPYHKVLLPLLLLLFIGSGVNLWKSMGDHERLYSAALLFVLVFCTMLAALFARLFALGAQDRAIRAEESLRHFVLTGKLPDARLTLKQYVALRFAPDAEFVELAKQAADKGMSQKDIKQAIKSWKPDNERV